MTEKDKLLENLAEKSGKSIDDLKNLVADKVNELSGLVSDEGAIYIIANDLGVRLESERPKKDADLTKIEDITEPKTPVSLLCRVLRMYDRVTFSSKSGSEGSVQNILVGDETGIIRVVFWNDKTELLENIHEGDVLKIINAYTRENANFERIEIHYGQYSDIEVNPEGEAVEVKEFKVSSVEFTEKKISDIEEGERNVKLSGVVTEFDIPRFYIACPECFKKVFQDEGSFKCAEHEEVEAIKVPIVNISIDDGSGGISIVSFRDRAENITKLKSEQIIGLTEDVDKYRDFSSKIIGSKVEVGGNIGVNNMTGEKQLLVNQVISIKLSGGSNEESGEKNIADSKKEEDKVDNKKADVKKEDIKKKDKEVSEDDLDMDIEEIDIDDDLL